MARYQLQGWLRALDADIEGAPVQPPVRPEPKAIVPQLKYDSAINCRSRRGHNKGQINRLSEANLEIPLVVKQRAKNATVIGPDALTRGPRHCLHKEA